VCRGRNKKQKNIPKQNIQGTNKYVGAYRGMPSPSINWGDGMCIAKEYVITITKILQDIGKTYEYNYDLVNQKDKETQDLLHELELGKLDYKRGNKLAKQLKRVRQERRQAMDENSTLKILYDYFKDKPLLKDTQKLHQAIVKEEDKLKSRTYQPRVREDMTITDKKPDTAIKRALASAKG
jgi:hypothetical protein